MVWKKLHSSSFLAVLCRVETYIYCGKLAETHIFLLPISEGKTIDFCWWKMFLKSITYFSVTYCIVQRCTHLLWFCTTFQFLGHCPGNSRHFLGEKLIPFLFVYALICIKFVHFFKASLSLIFNIFWRNELLVYFFLVFVLLIEVQNWSF